MFKLAALYSRRFFHQEFSWPKNAPVLQTLEPNKLADVFHGWKAIFAPHFNPLVNLWVPKHKLSMYAAAL